MLKETPDLISLNCTVYIYNSGYNHNRTVKLACPRYLTPSTSILSEMKDGHPGSRYSCGFLSSWFYVF